MSYANLDVLAFYKELPFNYRETVEAQVASIRAHDLATDYPILTPLLEPDAHVLEVGCGVGWLACSIAHFHGCAVTAIDFNPVAIERARALAASMALPVQFHTADLFAYEPERPADVVISLGVLHHTNDCAAGVRRCLEYFTAVDGFCMFGLYHAYGRKPFLDHFRKMAADGASEQVMLAEYGRLHNWITDSTHLYSWFRDQVLHPHETQHTLRELVAIGEQCGCELVSTSINRFGPVDDLEALYRSEPQYDDIGRQKLRNGIYFPGFFVTLFKRRRIQ